MKASRVGSWSVCRKLVLSGLLLCALAMGACDCGGSPAREGGEREGKAEAGSPQQEPGRRDAAEPGVEPQKEPAPPEPAGDSGLPDASKPEPQSEPQSEPQFEPQSEPSFEAGPELEPRAEPTPEPDGGERLPELPVERLPELPPEPQVCTPGQSRPCWTGLPGQQSKGLCKAGTQTCQSHGDWGSCQGEIKPSPELCNGKDDDCDGQIDEKSASITPLEHVELSLLRGHNFSPNGKWLVSYVERSGVVIVRDGQSYAHVKSLSTFAGGALYAGFSGDNQRLVTVHDNQGILVWSTSTWKLERKIEVRSLNAAMIPGGTTLAHLTSNALERYDISTGKKLSSLAFSSARRLAAHPDKKHVVVADTKGVLHIWDASGNTIARTIQAHSRFATALAISPDGKVLLSTTSGETKLFDFATGKLLRQLSNFANGQPPAFSPNSKFLWMCRYGRGLSQFEVSTGQRKKHYSRQLCGNVTLDPQGKRMVWWRSTAPLEVWDIATEKLVESQILPHHNGALAALEWSPDGKQLLSLGGTLMRWDAATGRRTSWVQPTAAAQGATFDPKGSRYAVCSGSTVELRKTSDDSLIRTFSHSSNCDRQCQWSADGKSLWRMGTRFACLFQISDGKLLHSFKSTSSRNNLSGLLGPLGKTAATVAYDDLQVWDATTGKLLWDVHLPSHTAYSEQLAFSPNGKEVAVLTSAWLLRYDVATGRSLSKWKGLGTALAWSPNGQLLALGNLSGQIALWDIKTGKLQSTHSAHAKRITHLRWKSPSRLASAAEDGELRTWDPTTFTPVQRMHFPQHSGSIVKVALSRDGRVALSGSERARMWDALNPRFIRLFQSGSAALKGLALSPDGKRLYTASTELLEWDATTGRLRKAFDQTGVQFWFAMDLHPQAATLAAVAQTTASGNKLNEIYWFDTQTGKRSSISKGHTDYIVQLRFGATGKYLLSASGDMTARIWDATTGQSLLTFNKHSAALVGGCISTNDKHVATFDQNKGLLLWERSTGKQLYALSNTQQIYSCAFSPKTGRLYTTDQSGHLRIWDPTNGALVQSIAAHHGAARDLQFNGSGSLLLTGGADRQLKTWSCLP